MLQNNNNAKISVGHTITTNGDIFKYTYLTLNESKCTCMDEGYARRNSPVMYLYLFRY